MQSISSNQYASDEKKKLCQRLTTLPPSRTKEIYSLILEYAKTSTETFARRLGNKSTVPFGGKRVGDNYEFDIDNLPPQLLSTIEQLINIE